MRSKQNDCECKVGRVTTKYEVQKTEFLEAWQTGTSIRQLTEELNKDIIESALTTVNVGRVAWDRSRVYEALHTNKLSDADEIEIYRELERTGVNAKQLSSDLVSHQTVYRHLKQCLDASKESEQTPEERREKAKNTVHALQQRTEVVTESTLETLQAAGVIDLGDTNVVVDIQVACGNCGRSMDFGSAISEGCDCDSV